MLWNGVRGSSSLNPLTLRPSQLQHVDLAVSMGQREETVRAGLGEVKSWCLHRLDPWPQPCLPLSGGRAHICHGIEDRTLSSCRILQLQSSRGTGRLAEFVWTRALAFDQLSLNACVEAARAKGDPRTVCVPLPQGLNTSFCWETPQDRALAAVFVDPNGSYNNLELCAGPLRVCLRNWLCSVEVEAPETTALPYPHRFRSPAAHPLCRQLDAETQKCWSLVVALRKGQGR